MKKNVGTIDRWIRVALGIILAALYIGGIVSGATGIIVLIIGVVLLATSVFSFCPLYSLLRITTCTSCSGDVQKDTQKSNDKGDTGNAETTHGEVNGNNN